MLDACMDDGTERDRRSSALKTERSSLFQAVILTKGTQDP